MTITPDDRAAPSAGLLLERADAAAAAAPEQAVALYRELLAAMPDHTECRLRLARLLESRGDLDDAVRTLTTGIRVTPGEPELYVLRGIVLGRLRRYPEAEADLRAVLRDHPLNGAAHFELGQVLWRKGLAAEAATHFTKSLEYDPENGRAFYYLAEALNLMGDLQGANEALERALEATPREGKAYHLRGRVLDRLGRPDEARQMYQRSRELQDL